MLAGYSLKQRLCRQADGPITDLLLVNKPPPPGGAFRISRWFDGPSVPIGWDIGGFTGFSPTDPLNTQRGVDPATFGSAAIQAQGGVVGVLLSTSGATPSAGNPTQTGMLTVDAGWSLDTMPFVGPDDVLAISVDLQVTSVAASGGFIPYVELWAFCTIAAARVPALAKDVGWWQGGTIFDLRGWSAVSAGVQAPEQGTGVPIVSGLIGADSLFSTGLGGAALQAAPWTDGRRKFILGIAAGDVQEALVRIKHRHPRRTAAWPTDPAVVAVTGVTLNMEAAADAGSDGAMGLAFAGLSAEVYGPSV